MKIETAYWVAVSHLFLLSFPCLVWSSFVCIRVALLRISEILWWFILIRTMNGKVISFCPQQYSCRLLHHLHPLLPPFPVRRCYALLFPSAKRVVRPTYRTSDHVLGTSSPFVLVGWWWLDGHKKLYMGIRWWEEFGAITRWWLQHTFSVSLFLIRVIPII